MPKLKDQREFYFLFLSIWIGIFLLCRFRRCRVGAFVGLFLTMSELRGQMKCMVIDWWVRASETWEYQELLQWFIDVCWEERTAAYAAALAQRQLNKSHTGTAFLLGVETQVLAA